MKQFSFERAQNEADNKKAAAEEALKESGYAPEGWLTTTALHKLSNKSHITIRIEADKYRKSHPEWFKNYPDIRGKIREHYSPELVERLRLEFSKYESAPNGWLTNAALGILLEKSPQTLDVEADKYLESHPEWFRSYLDKSNHIHKHYSPELIEQLKFEFSKHEFASMGWLTAGALRKLLNKDHKLITKHTDKYRESHPEWFKDYLDDGGNIREHLSPELIELLKKEFSKYEPAPEKWFIAKPLTKILNKSHQTILKEVEKYRTDHPEWFKEYLDGGGRIREHYSPELIELLKKEFELPKAPKNWQSKEEIAKKTGVSIEQAGKIIAKLKKQFPEKHGKFKAKNEE